MTFRTSLRAGACAAALVSLTAISAMASQPPSSSAERQQTAQLNEQQLSNPGAAMDGANANESNNMATPASDTVNGTMRHRHHHHAQSTSTDQTPGSANNDMNGDKNMPTNGAVGDPSDGGPRNNPGSPQPH